MLVSKEDYQEFLEHYEWQLIKSPDYRLGQAFLTYFPQISKAMITDGDLGTLDEYRLYNETDKIIAQAKIDKWLEI